MKKQIMLGLLAAIISGSSLAAVDLKVKPNSANVTKGSSVGAYANYDIVIRNNTSEKQIYSYSAVLCPDLNKCEQQIKNNITIMPNDSYVESFKLGTMVRYNRTGYFANKGTLTVTGYENNQKIEIGYITVY